MKKINWKRVSAVAGAGAAAAASGGALYLQYQYGVPPEATQSVLQKLGALLGF